MGDHERINVLREYARLHRAIWAVQRRDDGPFPFWETQADVDSANQRAQAMNLQIARIWSDVEEAARSANLSVLTLSGSRHPNDVDFAIEWAVTELGKRVDASRAADEARARADAERAQKRAAKESDRLAKAQRREEQRQRWGFLFPIRAAVDIWADFGTVAGWIVRLARGLLGL